MDLGPQMRAERKAPRFALVQPGCRAVLVLAKNWLRSSRVQCLSTTASGALRRWRGIWFPWTRRSSCSHQELAKLN